MSEPSRFEGYWRRSEKEKSDLPFPYPNVLFEDEAKEIYNLIKEKEKTARKIQYRGFSISRIDGSMVGSREYSVDGWNWPEALPDHYVLKHRVMPSEDFLRFIGFLK